MALEDTLLDILVCPIDKRGLLYFADDAVLYNPRLRRLYRIENDIPLMLARQAIPVPEEEHGRLMKCAQQGEVTRVTAGQGDIGTGDLTRQLVDSQPGLADQHHGARKPGRGQWPRPVRVKKYEPDPGRTQHRRQRSPAGDRPVEPAGGRLVGRQRHVPHGRPLVPDHLARHQP